MGVHASPRLWERVEAAWSNISHMRGKKPHMHQMSMVIIIYIIIMVNAVITIYVTPNTVSAVMACLRWSPVQVRCSQGR
jgi:hypothetical protein